MVAVGDFGFFLHEIYTYILCLFNNFLVSNTYLSIFFNFYENTVGQKILKSPGTGHQFLNWENCQKCNFTKNIFDLFDFTSFMAWTF